MAHEERRMLEVTSSNQVISTEMGMLGMSLQDIAQGGKGYVKLPVGTRDLTMAGGRKWVKLKVTTMEDVRAFRDIIVGNDQGEVKEHTPVELSYEKAAGGYQRVGENYPLPVADFAYAEKASVRATAAGNTLIVAPSSGQKLNVKFIYVFNSGIASNTVDCRFAVDGTSHFRGNLAPQTGYTLNLIDSNIRGGTDEGLYVNLTAIGTIDCTVLYKEIA